MFIVIIILAGVLLDIGRPLQIHMSLAITNQILFALTKIQTALKSSASDHVDDATAEHSSSTPKASATGFGTLLLDLEDVRS
jgi:hypothetical protein